MIFKTNNKTVYPIIFETSYEGLGSINCYIYDNGESYTLIDAGIENSDYEKYFKDALTHYGLAISDISRVLFTHFHSDHVGLIKLLQQEGVQQYYASALAIPRILQQPAYLTKKVQIYKDIYARYGVLTYASERLRKLQATAESAKEKDLQITPIQEGEAIAGLQVIHTPGHSPDSISFYDADTGWLFSGDLLFKSGIGSALIEYNENDEIVSAYSQYNDSIRKLESLNVATVFPGHAVPFSNLEDVIDTAQSKMDYKFNKLIDHIKKGTNTTEKLGLEIYGERFEPLFTYTVSEIVGLLQLAEQKQMIEKNLIDDQYVFSML